MRISTSMRWLVVAISAAMLLAVAAACSSETIEVPGETVVVEKVVTETVEVPGETVVVEKEVIKTVEVPGETVTKEVVKEVMVPGETVVVEKEVVKTVEVPGETVTVEVPRRDRRRGERGRQDRLGPRRDRVVVQGRGHQDRRGSRRDRRRGPKEVVKIRRGPREEVCDRPLHRQGGARAGVWRDIDRSLARIHRRRTSGQCPEAARRCSCESGIMVLKQKTDPRTRSTQ